LLAAATPFIARAVLRWPNMDDPAASQRYYAMDALRSSMMLLGIVLHAALPYTTVHIRVQFKDPDTHVVFDVLVFFLHSFRRGGDSDPIWDLPSLREVHGDRYCA
jgi:hypothetical protein